MTFFAIDHGSDLDGLPGHDGTRHPRMRAAAVLTVRGDVDGAAVDALRDGIRPLLTAGQGLVIDMSDVGFLGPSGLRFLVELHHECQTVGRQWALVAGGVVRRLLQAVGADPTIPLVESMVEALRAARVVDGSPGRLIPRVDRRKLRC